MDVYKNDINRIGWNEVEFPLVSVIMGVYNPNELYLNESIQSILNQTYNNFEFIICNDGSTSNVNLFKKISELDDRIVVIDNDVNKGLAYSLNACLKIAKGKYIARQDADDISEKNRLLEQVQFLNKNSQYAFVSNNIKYFDNENDLGFFNFPEFPQYDDFLFVCPFIHGCTMFVKKFLLLVGGYRVSDETYRCEDYDLYIRMYIKGCIGSNIQKILYRVRENTNSKKRRKFKYRLDEMKIRKKYFKKMGFGWERYFYIIKPILVGLIPLFLLERVKNIYYKYRRNYDGKV